MAKMLRLHRTGTMHEKGWDRTGPIGRNEIEGPGGILDPEGARAAQLAVALPTPFARMHLVETALAFVSSPAGAALPDSVHHRLVGQFWDVWELVFNYFQRRQPGQRLDVRPWRRADELARLEANPATRPLAQVLRLYLNDPRFAGLTELHLLYSPGPTPADPPQLIGGTSPLTVFFPAPAPRALAVQRPQGGGHYLDGRYVALGQREQAFQDYVYQLFAADETLRREARAVYAALDEATVRRWSLDGTAQPANYPVLTDRAGNPVAVAGVPVRVRPDESVVRSSDFVVQPSQPAARRPAGPLPLVLRPGLQAPGKNYYNQTPLAESGAAVLAQDPRPLANRLLPGVELPYPYLTTDDWLEDTLLTVPYELDGSRFETGQLSVAPGYRPTCWPLLPLKARYFDYFTQADLATHLRLELDPACVRVRLRIPVGPPGSSDAVEYERAYYPNPRTEGLGRLLTTNVGLSIFPFVKILDAPPGGGTYNDFYKVMLVDANNIDVQLVHKNIELRFGVDGRVLTETGTEQRATAYRRTLKTGSIEGSTYYEVRGTHFDYLEVLSPAPAAGRGLVVPRWREVRQGTKEFRFAIDFGTTNTHVAYHDAPGQPPLPLSFGPDDSPVALLKKPADMPERTAYERLFAGVGYDADRGIKLYGWQVYQQREFVPPLLGTGGSPYQFPIRTATSEAAGFPVEPPQLLANLNIGFGINTEQYTNESYQTNLKWGGTTQAARDRVELFFREMLLLFKAKAALNGGSLSATQVVWFAPLSFSSFSRSLYQSKWDSLFREIFHSTRATTYLPESSAPYFFLTRRGIVTPGPGESAAFVDIGGGTSDVLFYADTAAAEGAATSPARRHRPVFSTSFRFAGNDLWGDGAADVRGSKDNGLVVYGLRAVEATPLPASAENALRCLEVVRRNPAFGSEEIASLLFNYEADFKFGDKLLHAQHLRVLFYLHFGALVYHLGQVALSQQQAPPRYLCFTGRGSLYLRLLSPDLRLLERVARRILAHVMRQAPPDNFRIVLADDPKQTTANGGVLATGLDAESTADAPALVQAVGTGDPGADELRPLRPNDITEAVKNAVLANVGRCLDLLLTDPDLTRLQTELGIKNPPGVVRASLDRHLADSFNLSRQRYADELPVGETIPETLFFLPFKHALYELSRELL